MFNYIKKVLFTLLILGMPYMNSASKTMNAEDYDGSVLRVHNVNFVAEDRQDLHSSIKQSTSSQIESLEDSQTSLASYFLYPAKSIIHTTYELMTFATKSPNHALFVGAFLAYQVTAVAADCCVTYYSHVPTTRYTCSDTSIACSYPPGDYPNKMIFPPQGCGKMEFSNYFLLNISPGSCKGGGQ